MEATSFGFRLFEDKILILKKIMLKLNTFIHHLQLISQKLPSYITDRYCSSLHCSLDYTVNTFSLTFLIPYFLSIYRAKRNYKVTKTSLRSC